MKLLKGAGSTKISFKLSKKSLKFRSKFYFLQSLLHILKSLQLGNFVQSGSTALSTLCITCQRQPPMNIKNITNSTVHLAIFSVFCCLRYEC